MKEYKVVAFSEEHIEKAAEIEALCFSEPWSKDAMRLLCTPEYPSLAIIEEDGKCVGYIGSAKALDELQIINIAVSPEYRGKGLGKALMAGFDELCEKTGTALVSLEVRESNGVAISLYQSFGYEVVGKRKGFYKAPIEDALVMLKNCRRGELSEDN